MAAMFAFGFHATCREVPAPQPTPSPTEAPSPEPTSNPEPCGLPAPQHEFDSCEGDRDPDHESAVVGAEKDLFDAEPSRFEGAWGGPVFLLKLDGTTARHEEPGSHEARRWLYDAAVAGVQSRGFCAGSFGTDELVVCDQGETSCTTWSIVNHGGADLRSHPPGYNGRVCRVF